MRAFAWLAICTLCVGCYGYYPSPDVIPRAGMRVEAELSDSGTFALARSVGPGVAAVEGRVLNVTDQEIQLSVLSVRQHSGLESDWRGEPVTVGRGLLQGLNERRFSAGRTALFAAGVAIGGVALRMAFDGRSSGGLPDVGSGPGTPR